MYSSYNSPPSELSNNPFVDHTSNALARYPDISSNSTGYPTGPTGQVGYGQPSGFSSGNYQQQQQMMQQQQMGWNPTQGYQAQGSTYSTLQAQPTTGQFQPSSAFGQQLAGQMGGGYGMAATPQQQHPSQLGGYGSASAYGGGYQQSQYAPQQAQQQTAQYIAEFDPYSSLNSISTPSSNTGYGQAPPPPQNQQAGGGSGYQHLHPREYIRQHKLEMETWDKYAWNQAFQSFDALKEAWSARKREIETRGKSMGGAGFFAGSGGPGGYGYGGMYGQAQELARLEQLAKQAEQNADSVAASTFQMREAFSGYRQSSDLTSKRRVRESINAALTSLPDWPPQFV